jgi:hypothetical protein
MVSPGFTTARALMSSAALLTVNVAPDNDAALDEATLLATLDELAELAPDVVALPPPPQAVKAHKANSINAQPMNRCNERPVDWSMTRVAIRLICGPIEY